MKVIQNMAPALAVAASLMGAHAAHADIINPTEFKKEFTFDFTATTAAERKDAKNAATKEIFTSQYDGDKKTNDYIGDDEKVVGYKGKYATVAKVQTTNANNEKLKMQIWAVDKQIFVDPTRISQAFAGGLSAWMDDTADPSNKAARGYAYIPGDGPTKNPPLRLITSLSQQDGLGVSSMDLNQYVKFETDKKEKKIYNLPLYFRDRIVSPGLDVNEALNLKPDLPAGQLASLKSVELLGIPRYSEVTITACGKVFRYTNASDNYESRSFNASEFRTNGTTPQNLSDFACPGYKFEISYDKNGQTTLPTKIKDLEVMYGNEPNFASVKRTFTYQPGSIHAPGVGTAGLHIKNVTVLTK